ncbi:MAG: filamentous hemagglutinin N-terminal domain-containing protein [Desulfamplus sp.]|nr:filamentous hemagglutinin N-terminal domain-containing protein [Desulfamplus sp.]
MPPKQLVNHSFLYLIVILFFLTSPTLLYADISTDGTVGAAQTLTGPDYTIPETLGTIKGDNLFHSFEKFSIKTEESATFTGSDSIKNIISRVTGGEKSEIDGTLRSNVGKADFYFINPSGVVFGQNAKVDVPAAFHVSTSDELKFQDGAYFEASKSKQSTLTQASPEAFGFLGTQLATVEVNEKVLENRGSIEINASNLEFKPESKVSFTSSKDITIHGNEEKFATLENVEGEIQFKAKESFVMDKAIIGVGGNGGGDVSIKASNAKLKMAAINADNIGNKDSDKGVDIEVQNELELSEGSSISSSTWADGDSGYVKINAGNIKIDGSGIEDFYTGIWCNANSSSIGNAGDVAIYVSGILEMINNARISSDIYPNSKGDGGSVFINAGNIRIDDMGIDDYSTGVWSDTYPNSEGNAGKVEIVLSGMLEILNGGEISSSTYSKGNSGDVNIKANNLRIDGYGNDNQYTGIWSDANLDSEGNAGSVNIKVSDLLELSNIAKISSDTWGIGNGGDVIINANQIKAEGVAQISSDTWSKGDGADVIITADSIDLNNSARISSIARGVGNAGIININTNNLRLDSYASVSSEARKLSGNAGTIDITASGNIELLHSSKISTATYSEGDAGKIKINAQNLKIDNNNQNQGVNDEFTGIWSDANPNSTGNAGEVEINITKFTQILNEGQISSDTYGEGDAGSVLLNTSELFMDNDGYIGSAAYINSKGYVGDVKINANSITLFNNSDISITALQTLTDEKLANLPDKSITLNTKKLYIEGESSITSESKANVPASDIRTNAEGIYIHDSFIDTSVFGTNGDGGNISINEHSESNPAGFLVMQNGFIQANTLAEGSKGGRIRINPDTLLIADKSMPFKIGGESEAFSLDDKKNVIQAADPLKNPQDIEAPTVPVDLASSLVNSGKIIFEPIKMAEHYCNLIGTSHESSLIYKARGGFAEMPSNLSSIFYGGSRLDDLMMYQENNQQN